MIPFGDIPMTKYFITHVAANHENVEIWAQTDPVTAIKVKSLLLNLSKKAKNNLNNEEIEVGENYLAGINQNDEVLYRCKVISKRGSNCLVVYIDFGCEKWLKTEQLYQVDVVCNSFPALANMYFLADVKPKHLFKGWNQNDVQHVLSPFLFSTLKGQTLGLYKNVEVIRFSDSHMNSILAQKIIESGCGVYEQSLYPLVQLPQSPKYFEDDLNEAFKLLNGHQNICYENKEETEVKLKKEDEKRKKEQEAEKHKREEEAKRKEIEEENRKKERKRKMDEERKKVEEEKRMEEIKRKLEEKHRQEMEARLKKEEDEKRKKEEEENRKKQIEAERRRKEEEENRKKEEEEKVKKQIEEKSKEEDANRLKEEEEKYKKQIEEERRRKEEEANRKEQEEKQGQEKENMEKKKFEMDTKLDIKQFENEQLEKIAQKSEEKSPKKSPKTSPKVKYTVIKPNLNELFGKSVKFLITSVEKDATFYGQIEDIGNKFALLTAELQGFYSSDKAKSAKNIAVGDYIVAQFTEDLGWYRARVTSVSGDQIGVFYIDYGNSENVNKKSCKRMEKKFSEFAPILIKCKTNTKDTHTLEKMADEVNCVLVRMLDEETYLIQMYDNDNKLLFDGDFDETLVQFKD